MDELQSRYPDDPLACKIVDHWTKWNTARLNWLEDKKELREYLHGTDTTKTSNRKLPWKNSTVTPKLTQIRDNLHANYMAALFPNDDWFYWETTEKTPDVMRKKNAIESYMRSKLKESKFQLLVSQLVYDYIDYGNVIASHEFVKQAAMAGEDTTSIYVGPKAFRVNPMDVVFNPISDSFQKSPLIRRVLKSVGQLIKDVEDKPNLGYNPSVVSKAVSMRKDCRDNPEMLKNHHLIIDGFGSFDEYVSSDMVELLEFWGDIYDIDTNTYYTNHIVTVIDRKWILRKEANPSWLGEKPFFHCGWRLRTDNLWAAGPLDQLVGLQYRIDHLENLKADVFDQIAYPVIKVLGNTVTDFVFAPGVKIQCGDEGDVDFLRPDATALQADLQIENLMERMEELAGAPKQAMGIRTPGEKTKYEVQSLENASGRIFQSKVAWFERNILEPLLNSMLEESRRNMGATETIKVSDPVLGVETFVDVSKEDFMATGSIYPIGARHFAEQAKFVQELQQTLLALQAYPEMKPHLSAKAIAKALEDNLGWNKWRIVQDNVAVFEMAETQRLTQQAGENLMAESQVPLETPAMEGEDSADPTEQIQTG